MVEKSGLLRHASRDKRTARFIDPILGDWRRRSLLPSFFVRKSSTIFFVGETKGLGLLTPGQIDERRRKNGKSLDLYYFWKFLAPLVKESHISEDLRCKHEFSLLFCKARLENSAISIFLFAVEIVMDSFLEKPTSSLSIRKKFEAGEGFFNWISHIFLGMRQELNFRLPSDLGHKNAHYLDLVKRFIFTPFWMGEKTHFCKTKSRPGKQYFSAKQMY